VVLSGTGRSLRDHQWRLAGKTGTAEVAGAASHSWFIGFAPADAPRIAVAVIVEGGGAGAQRAVPMGGDLMTGYLNLSAE
jgi:peptidoglycan glycosyltransferase